MRALLPAAAAVMLGLALGGSAAETISWSAQPTLVTWNQPVTASGTIGSGRSDQLVTVQLRPCDEDAWRDLGEATTTSGGAWAVDLVANIGGFIRARSGDAVTDPVTIRQRPWVFFSQRRPGRFRAGVQAYRQFWHRKMAIQRFDTKTRTWVTVKRVLLTETAGSGAQSDVASTTDQFRVDVPKGTTLRATLPLSEARPCYLAGYSALLRR
jgi:hypothetical protein